MMARNTSNIKHKALIRYQVLERAAILSRCQMTERCDRRRHQALAKKATRKARLDRLREMFDQARLALSCGHLFPNSADCLCHREEPDRSPLAAFPASRLPIGSPQALRWQPLALARACIQGHLAFFALPSLSRPVALSTASICSPWVEGGYEGVFHTERWKTVSSPYGF